jgi:glycosyltransferase involved in cell wall biosynthesis
MVSERLSIVAPVYNEVQGVAQFVDVLFTVLDPLLYDSEIVLVDDGSTDGTGELLDQLQAAHPDRISVLHLSRNFGHQAALTAGMDHADGDAVICMDADLQHPPSLIPDMVQRWQHGFDIVQAVRRHTADSGVFKDLTAKGFYALINYLSSTRIEPNAADFRLLSRRVVEVFRKDIRERERFLRGLVAWVGFRSCCLEFDAAPRFAGHSKYSVPKMLSFARAGLISFSKVPLKLAALLGFLVSAVSLLYGLFAVCAYLFFNTAVLPGWASMILVGTFLGGCQLLFLGVLGEYVATLFDEIKARPLYIVAAAQRASRQRE